MPHIFDRMRALCFTSGGLRFVCSFIIGQCFKVILRWIKMAPLKALLSKMDMKSVVVLLYFGYKRVYP